jgi:hypothetical protein
MFIRHIPVSNPCGAAFAVQIVFPDDLSMLAITLTAPLHCSQVSNSIPKTRLSFCAQVIDWCFCARIFSCPVGNAFLPYFVRLALLSRGDDCLVEATLRGPPCEGRPARAAPHKYTMKARQINSGFGHQNQRGQVFDL